MSSFIHEANIPISKEKPAGLHRLFGAWAAVARRISTSLRARLVVVVLAIDVVAATLSAAVVVYQARSATAVEIASSTQLAELLVTDTIGLMREASTSLLLQTIDLHFQSVRHVRIAVTDADGRPVQAISGLGPKTLQAPTEPSVPDWFGWLIAPKPDVKVVPVLLRNALVGTVTITSEPADEIGEAWHYARALLQAGLALNIAVLFVLILSFGRVLAPLSSLVAGLKDFEHQNYAVRLRRPNLRELADIADHFNRTAEALAASQAANRKLNRELLTAQDDERRRTALELHDEVGPCLFSLDVDARAIARIAADLADGTPILSRAEDVVAMVERLQGVNRRVLDSLRPMGLGRLPLRDCLMKLLVDFGDPRMPPIDHGIGRLAASYGHLVDLTVYRCVQEGLLNAVRHAKASRIRLEVHDRGDGPCARRIDILIRDDGTGLPPAPRTGVGLAGMRERVEALGGRFEVRTSAQGTALAIAVPLDDVAPAAAPAPGARLLAS